MLRPAAHAPTYVVSQNSRPVLRPCPAPTLYRPDAQVLADQVGARRGERHAGRASCRRSCSPRSITWPKDACRHRGRVGRDRSSIPWGGGRSEGGDGGARPPPLFGRPFRLSRRSPCGRIPIDGDLAWLGASGDRDAQGEHTCVVVRKDVLGVEGVGEPDLEPGKRVDDRYVGRAMRAQHPAPTAGRPDQHPFASHVARPAAPELTRSGAGFGSKPPVFAPRVRASGLGCGGRRHSGHSARQRPGEPRNRLQAGQRRDCEPSRPWLHPHPHQDATPAAERSTASAPPPPSGAEAGRSARYDRTPPADATVNPFRCGLVRATRSRQAALLGWVRTTRHWGVRPGSGGHSSDWRSMEGKS